MAFSRQGEDAAFATLDEAFPTVLAPAPDPIPSGDRVVKYVNDEYAAIVVPVDKAKASPEARKRRLMTSTLPMRAKNAEGKLAPVSTDVTEPTPGELKPENALVDVVVHRDLRQGIEFPDADVVVRPKGISVEQPATVRKDRVFWANVQVDTDLMVNMRPDGVETYDVLRSQQSPERLSYEVDVPEGGGVALDADKQTIDITDKDGKRIAHVGAPHAVDADGTLVPTRWNVQGPLLQIEVDHRKADFRYPILVDPLFTAYQLSWSNGTSTDYRGWVFAESNPGALAKQAGNAGLGAGLNIWLPPNLTVPQGLWGAWEFGAPGDTYVSRFEMAHFSWWPWGGRSCAVAGILATDNPITWNPGTVTGTSGPTTSPWGWCANHLPGGVSNWYLVHQVGPGFTRGNRAAIQWLAPATASGAASDWILLGGAYVEVTDDMAPGNHFVFGLPPAWTNNPAVAFSAYATDYGLGMNYMEVQINGDTKGSQDLNCDPDWRNAVHCPATQRVDVIETVPEGINDVDVYGEDALGSGGWDNMGFAARVDRGYPAMSLTGGAYDLRGQQLGELSYKLHVEAWDSSPGSIDVSGVGSIEFLVNGQRKGYVSQGCDQNCLEGDGAPLSADFLFDATSLADGAYQLQVKVTDRAGNANIPDGSDTWTVNVVSGTVTGPRTGLHVPRRATLEAHARRSGITNVRWEYRTAAEGGTPAGSWTTIPVTALRDSVGSQPSSTTIAVTNADSVPVSWDIKATPGLGTQSKALEVRGVFNVGTTNTSRVHFDTKGLDDRTAQESIGPGTVNLLTGNFSLTAGDVNIDSGLAPLQVNSTYNSRDAATVGPLGPGWKFSAPVLDNVETVDRVVDRWGLGYVELVLGDGTSVPFTSGASGLTPAVGYERYSLQLEYPSQGGFGSTREYVLTDETTGSTTVLRTDAGGGGTYLPAVVREGLPATAVTATYETVGGNRRIKTLYGPGAPGGDCVSTFTNDCRALLFVYASTTTATGTLPANWGDYTGRLARIDLKTLDPATGNPVIQAVSSYSYDSTGRLRASWDPRISPALKSQYAYDANGLMISAADAGETPWTMSYTQIGGETELGRLSQASRALPAGSSTWTVAYNLPMSGTNAPMDMSPATVLAASSWGQVDLPTDATAIFPPDQVPALPTSDYTRATVHYLNRDGYAVNELDPGGELSTSERDRYGNIVRELSARNRALSLQSSTPAAQSRYLDTQRTYQDKGLNLTNEIGPYHSVRLDTGEVVLARRRTVTRYDETKPAGDTTNYHLPTTQIVAAQVSGRADQDARTTTTDYDWTLRKPTRIVKGAQAGGPALTETMQYMSNTGLLLSHRQPKSPNTDGPSTTKYLYYGTLGCNHTEWQWQLCQKSVGVQPGGSHPALPTTTYQYNRLGQVTSEARGSRVETTTYDTAGRETQTAWSGPGTAVPTTTTTYDSTTGREATKSAVVNGSTRTIESHYDSAGQLTEYVDGTGQSSTTTYDLLGRPLVADDGKGTQTNTYDAVTGRLKQIVDSQAGTFAATYDADGRILTKTLPNGMRATYQYDEMGQSKDLTWVKTTGCSANCTWLHYGVMRSVFGQQRLLSSTAAEIFYLYDGVGRLTEVRETPTGQPCTARKYTYDLDSNRTQQSTYPPGSGGACDLTTTPTHVSHVYDSADRLLDSGIVYDAQGRITTLPAGAEDALVSTYFADDLTRSQSQSDTTNTYDLDPERRSMVRSRTSASGTGTETSHYSDETDSPSWTATDDGHWTRNVSGIDGDLVATVEDSAGAVLQLTDLHGDVAATAATASTKVDDAQVLQVARSGSSWSADPTRSLAPGAYTARVRQNDASGNVGSSAATRFTVGADAGPDVAYRDLVVSDVPEAYWRLGESSGTTAVDQTGAHSGSYVGGPALAQPGALIGDTDTSVAFDGVNDGVSAVDQPWRSPNGFTVESWIKTGRRGGTLMSQGASTDNNNWKVRVEDSGGSVGKIQAVYKVGPRTLTGYSSIRVDDNRWHHVTASFMPSGMTRVTVDGQASSTAAAPVSTLPTYAYGFDELAGTLAVNSGTETASFAGISGAIRIPSGRFGGALNFNSAGTYVEAMETAGLASPLTVEAWVKPTASSSGLVVGKGSFFQMGTKLNTTLNPFGSIGTATSTATTPTLPLNAWSHLAMTWDQATTSMKIYVNAQLIQTVSAPGPASFAGNLRIGALGAGFFAGTIDEVKVYKRVLTQAEIAVDQNVPVNAAATNSPSVALGLDDNLGNVVADSSGNRRNVTLAGVNTWAVGKFGSGVQFNGTNYGSITDPGIATTTTGITLSSWIKTAGIQTVPFLGATTFGLYGQRSAGVGPGVCVGASCWSLSSATNGIWTHVTATYDKVTGSLRLYANGTLAVNTVIAPNANLLPDGLVSIGRDMINGQVAFSAGSVDEIRVYPRPLSAAEITREWNLSVAQTPGGDEPRVTIGNAGGANTFVGKIDEVATYGRVLVDAEIAEHSRTGSPSNKIVTPSIASPVASPAVADATPIFSGTSAGPNVRVDVFTGTDTSGSPIQSLLSKPTVSWSAESAKGLPNGTYTAKITESDASGRYATAAPRTFSIAGATDPETGYATSVRADTPRAYWRLGESSGSVAADDLTAHPGTYTGGLSLGGTGALISDADKAPTFDGVDDRVDSPNTSGYFDPGTGDFTVEAWVKTTVNGNQVIATKGTNWQLAVTSAAGNVGKARLTYANGAVTAYSTGRVDDGSWHHVMAVVKRATGARVYVDGVPGTETGGANGTSLSDANPVRIGADATTGGSFSGQIDEVAVYNGALGAVRALAHYRLGAQLDSTAPSPTITAPTDGSSTTNAALNFTGAAGSNANDAAALTLNITPDPNGGLLSVFSYDEFGTPRGPSQANRYGYLGGKQRSAELPSGVIQMGVRSYVPSLGRFLQVDPVEGGSANPYDYVNQDPLNVYDLDGNLPDPFRALNCLVMCKKKAQRIITHARQHPVETALALVPIPAFRIGGVLARTPAGRRAAAAGLIIVAAHSPLRQPVRQVARTLERRAEVARHTTPIRNTRPPKRRR